MFKRFRNVLGWTRRHKRRAAGLLCGGVIAGYGVAYAIGCQSYSPTDRVMTLADGREVAYLVVGEASPPPPPPPVGHEGREDEEEGVRPLRVILIHGAPTTAYCWTRFIANHADAFDGAEIIAIDRLGYGNSSRGIEADLEDHARSIEPFLPGAEEAESSGGAILVGHSYGGPVALRAAAEYPVRVGGLVLVAGAMDPEMNDAVWFREAVEALGVLVPRPWRAANRELLELNRGGEDGGDNTLLRDSGLLERVRCPVVVIHGTWDAVCPHDATIEYVREALPNAADVRVVSLPRAGHNLHLSHHEVIAAEVGRLLEEK